MSFTSPGVSSQLQSSPTSSSVSFKIGADGAYICQVKDGSSVVRDLALILDDCLNYDCSLIDDTLLSSSHISLNISDADVLFALTRCDGTIRYIPSHRTILSARSKHFRLMFSTKNGSFAESKQLLISIPDVEVESFIVLLRYWYTGTFTLAATDVTLVARWANFFREDGLMTMCLTLMTQTLTTESALAIIRQGFRIDSIENICMEYIENNASHIDFLNSIDFYMLPDDIILRIVSSDLLAMSELDLIGVVNAWIDNDHGSISEKERRHLLLKSELLSSIRLPLIPHASLLSLDNSWDANNILEAVRFHDYPELIKNATERRFCARGLFPLCHTDLDVNFDFKTGFIVRRARRTFTPGRSGFIRGPNSRGLLSRHDSPPFVVSNYVCDDRVNGGARVVDESNIEDDCYYWEMELVEGGGGWVGVYVGFLEECQRGPDSYIPGSYLLKVGENLINDGRVCTFSSSLNLLDHAGLSSRIGIYLDMDYERIAFFISNEPEESTAILSTNFALAFSGFQSPEEGTILPGRSLAQNKTVNAKNKPDLRLCVGITHIGPSIAIKPKGLSNISIAIKNEIRRRIKSEQALQASNSSSSSSDDSSF